VTGCDTGRPGAGHSGHPGHRAQHGAHHHDVRRTPSSHPGGHKSHPTSPPTLPVPPSAAEAVAELDRLVVRPRPVGTEGYVRDAFGSDWVDTDHDVLAGTWHDPYTGRTLRFTDLKDLAQAEAIQIDHVVPLAEAWVSGARGWSRDRREVFANDLGELLAVDGPTNMSKGDGDPAAWRPRQGYQCAYARRWIAVKLRYGLAVDPPEKAALTQMLGYCR
jgi:hypothetical protein